MKIGAEVSKSAIGFSSKDGYVPHHFHVGFLLTPNRPQCKSDCLEVSIAGFKISHLMVKVSLDHYEHWSGVSKNPTGICSKDGVSASPAIYWTFPYPRQKAL